MNYVRQNIRKLRIDRDIPQDQLGQRLGRCRAAIAHYESGDNTPPLDILIRMCDLFDVTLDELCMQEL